jgi:hypothetical protein
MAHLVVISLAASNAKAARVARGGLKTNVHGIAKLPRHKIELLRSKDCSASADHERLLGILINHIGPPEAQNSADATGRRRIVASEA